MYDGASVRGPKARGVCSIPRRGEPAQPLDPYIIMYKAGIGIAVHIGTRTRYKDEVQNMYHNDPLVLAQKLRSGLARKEAVKEFKASVLRAMEAWVIAEAEIKKLVASLDSTTPTGPTAN